MIDTDFEDLGLESGSAYVGRLRGHDGAYEMLLGQTKWSIRKMIMYGREVSLPRLTAWYGDSDSQYTYSGIKNRPMEWTPYLRLLKLELETALGVSFNSVLLNLYRDGSDSIAFHADDEKELGQTPTIASLSFGGTRKFQMKSKIDGERIDVDLEDGTLLVMAGKTQQNWLHSIPKTAHADPRINLTFRNILN